MNSRILRLKRLITKHALAQGFDAKIQKLKRKKWVFLKSLREKEGFTNPLISVLKTGREQVKASFKEQKLIIHRSKLFFSLRKTKSLKRAISWLSFVIKKGNRFRDLKFLNLLERRLIVLLLRSGFFSRLRVALSAIKSGDIYIDGKKVIFPSYLVRLGSIVHVQGKARLFVIDFLTHQNLLSKRTTEKRSSISSSGINRPLFRSQKLKSFKQRIISCSILQDTLTELFFLEDTIIRGSQKKKTTDLIKREGPSSFLSPNCLIVDFVALSFCLKNTVNHMSIMTMLKQFLPSIRLWKI